MPLKATQTQCYAQINELQSADSSVRFVRWQSIQVTQLGFVLNLVMGFAVAGLGLWVSLLRDTSFQYVTLRDRGYMLESLLSCPPSLVVCGLDDLFAWFCSDLNGKP
jgi:hypothetical protein